VLQQIGKSITRNAECWEYDSRLPFPLATYH
jgi:hypothetical protein